MNKLQKMLRSSSKDIKGIRADILTDGMKRSQNRLVMALEDEMAALQSKLVSLSDMYPNSEMTLRIVAKDFDPNKWVEDTQSLKMQILEKKVELEAAKETTTEWFDDDLATDPAD